MVLAAGLGTRLRPLTDLLPKPILPIGDRTSLALALARVTASRAPRVVVNAHHGAARLRASVEAEFPGVLVSEERELLGTAGGLARAAHDLGAGDALVWNADCLVEVQLDGFVAAHASAKGEATLLVRQRPRGEGSVGVDDGGRVVRLRGERIADETSGGDFLSVHVIGAALRASLPGTGCLVADVYIPAMLRGATLRAVTYDGPFVDIGTPRNYLDANLVWLAPRSAWIGAGAAVSPAVSMEQVLVGPGATVRGHGHLERCVIWPGSVATAPLRNAIVAGDLTLPIG
jgi:mannose-1-phosphate guanylyltransferase